MANETKIIEIKIDASQAIQTIVQLDTEIDKLKKNQDELKKSGQKNSEQYQENAIKIKEYSAQKRILQSEVQKEIKGTQDAMGAYAKLQIEYTKAAQKAKDLAAQHGVGNAKTQEATKKANDLNNKLKEIDASMGNHQRNVGNYAEALSGLNGNFVNNITVIKNFASSAGGLSGAVNTAKGSIAAFGKQLLSLLANPVVAIIAGIVAVFMILKNAISENGQATAKFNQILAPFKLILEIVNVALGKLVNIILDGVIATMKFVSKIAELIPGLNKINKVAEGAIKLKQEEQKLNADIREQNVTNAKDELRIAELRNKSREKDKYSTKERIDFLKEADSIEKQMNIEKVNLSIRSFNLFKKQMADRKQTYKDLTKDEKDTYKQLEAAVYNNRKEYYLNTMRLKSQLSNATIEIQKEEDKKIEERRKKQEEKEKAIAERKRIEAEYEINLFNSLSKRRQDDLDNYIKYLTDVEKNVADIKKIIRTGIEEEISSAESVDNINQYLNDLEQARQIIAQNSADEGFKFEQERLKKEYDLKIQNAKAVGASTVEIEKAYAAEIDDLRTKKLLAYLNNTANALGQIQGLFEEGTKAAKITESAQVAINSISGAIAAFKSVAGIPVVGPYLGAAAAAGVIASGVKAIKDIWAVDEKNGATSVPATPVQTPDLTSKISAPMASTAQQVAGFGGANTITSGAQNTSMGTNVINNIKVPKAVISIQELRDKENSVDYLDTLATV